METRRRRTAKSFFVLPWWIASRSLIEAYSWIDDSPQTYAKKYVIGSVGSPNDAAPPAAYAF